MSEWNIFKHRLFIVLIVFMYQSTIADAAAEGNTKGKKTATSIAN